MKRSAVLAAIIVAAAIALPAIAGDNLYSNSDYRFSLKYPQGWKMKEDKQKVEVPAEAAGMKVGGVDLGRMAGLEMVHVCFGEKKCNPGDFGKEPEIHLMMNSMAPVAKSERKAAKKEDASSEKGKDECDIVEKGKKNWAGTSTQFMTMRCPEKKKWRYTTTLTINRKAAKRSNMYMLQCTVRPDEKDKAKSFELYRSELKPQCDSAIATSRFMK
jgi:hypothetical protein